MSVLLLVFLVGLSAAQPHHGPDDGSVVTCYDCGGHGPDHEFPGCLQHTKQCHHDEVCQITYGGHRTEVKCHRQHDCHHGPAEAESQDCAAGGHRDPEGCHLCCSDDSCVSDALNKINQLVDLKPVENVQCPDNCPPHDTDCPASKHQCHENQYCQVTKDDNNGQFEAWCEDNDHMQHCQNQLAAGHCDHHHHHCLVGCCNSTQCVQSLLGGSSNTVTSQAPPDSPQPTTDGGQGLNTLTCGDISSLDCGALEVVCPKLNCPDVCDPCFAPIVTVPMTSASAGGAEGSSDPTMVSPDMDQTDKGTHVTSEEKDTSGCEDTLQDMSCSEAVDVCSSPLLVTFCKKFCGLCCESHLGAGL